MQEFTKHLPEFAVNLVVLLTALCAAAAGSLAMVKKVKEGWEGVFPKTTATDGAVVTQEKIIGTMMMETTTAAMLSSSQERLSDTMDEAVKEMVELRIVLNRVADRLAK